MLDARFLALCHDKEWASEGFHVHLHKVHLHNGWSPSICALSSRSSTRFGSTDLSLPSPLNNCIITAPNSLSISCTAKWKRQPPFILSSPAVYPRQPLITINAIISNLSQAIAYFLYWLMVFFWPRLSWLSTRNIALIYSIHNTAQVFQDSLRPVLDMSN